MPQVVLVCGRAAVNEALLTELGTDRAAGEWREVEGDATELAAELEEHTPATVVYCAASRGRRGQPDLQDAAACFAACAAAAGLQQLVVLSSAAVHEPSHGHPGLGDEGIALGPTRNPVVFGWRRLEELAQQTRLPAGAHLTLLRPVPVPVPGGDDYASRLLNGRWAPTLPGFDPPIQLLAVSDLARALVRVVEAGKGGVYHLAPAGAVSLHRALRLAGVHRLPLPRWLQAIGRALLAPLGLAAPLAQVESIRYPWTVSGEAMRCDLGFAPRQSSAQVAWCHRHGHTIPPPELADDDPYGQDRAYIDRYGRRLFRFVHDYYWRVEIQGLEHVPREGHGVLVGVHRGFMPFDGVMALHAMARWRGRYPRFLIHPTLVKFPFLANFMLKLGGLHACQENADWVLSRGELLGVYPEGIRGAFSMYRRAYELKKFGRDEYVRMALRNRAPLLPFATVGSAEIFPIIGRIRWSWWKRYAEWPFFPIAPPFPLLPLPLPSKWHTWYLPPWHIEEEYGPEAADDPEVVRAVSEEVQRRLRGALDEMLRRRRHVFFGEIFDSAPRTVS